MKNPCVYINSNKSRNVLYVGVTSNPVERIAKHKAGFYEGFAKKYQCVDLLYYEQYEDMENVILREKQIKKFRRDKKEALIEKLNPNRADLFPSIV